MRVNVLERTPPMVITPEEADRAVDFLTRAIDAVASGDITDADVAAYSNW